MSEQKNKIILPLVADDIDLNDKSLFDNDDINITIQTFSNSEKLDILGIVETGIMANSTYYQSKIIETIRPHLQLGSKVPFAKYKLVIEYSTKYESSTFNTLPKDSFLRNLVNVLDFLFIITTKIPLPLIIGYSKENNNYSYQSSSLKQRFIQTDTNLGIATIEIIRKLISIILFPTAKNNDVQNKLKSLQALYQIALDPNHNTSGLSSATFVSIIEGFMASKDEITEVTYRVSLRLTKYLRKDYEFLRNIKRIYGCRSKFYHQGILSFTEDDYKLLFEISNKLCIDYFLYNNRFKADELDRLLITNM